MGIHLAHGFLELPLAPRPGGAKLGRLGALLGAFALSGLLHDFGMWGLGKEMEPRSVTGFFLLMSVGAALEYGFKQATGRRVGGLWGWVWCVVWSIGWGTMIIDAWTRCGLMTSDFSRSRLGQENGLLTQSSRCSEDNSISIYRS
jgi:hypothetical protein